MVVLATRERERDGEVIDGWRLNASSRARAILLGITAEHYPRRRHQPFQVQAFSSSFFPINSATRHDTFERSAADAAPAEYNSATFFVPDEDHTGPRSAPVVRSNRYPDQVPQCRQRNCQSAESFPWR